MSKNNVCKFCDLGLKRKDCDDFEYEECKKLFEIKLEKELDRKIVEVFLKPRTNYNNNM